MSNTHSQRILFCATTANQWRYTETALLSILNFRYDFPNLGIVVIDDPFVDSTGENCDELGAEIFEKRKPHGMTDSWSQASACSMIAQNDSAGHFIVPKQLRHRPNKLKSHFVLKLGAIGESKG